MANTLLLLPVLTACAGTYQGTKDGLTPYPGVPAAELDAAHAPRKLALLVGIDRFDDPAWRRLRYAGRDARELGAALLDPAHGGFDRVDLYTAPEETSRTGVLDALDDLATRVADPRDTVVVYLSTHGTLARDAHGALRSYVVARDTRMGDVRGTGVAMDEVRDRFSRLRSRRKALVLATCHSGQGKSALPEAVRRELAGVKGGAFFVPPLAAVSEASVVLSASAWGETAREDEALEHDIYTYFLLEALQEKLDRNGDGAVTVSEAHEHALHRTYAFTAGRQRPAAASDILGEDPIVLTGRRVRPGQPVLFGFGERWQDVRVRVNGTEKGALPGSVVLTPGAWAVELYRPGVAEPLVATDLELVAGERLDVQTLLADEARGIEIGLSAGGQGFFSQRAREEVFSPGPLLRLEAALRDLPLEGWTLAGDLGLGSHAAVLSPGGVALRADHRTMVGGLGLYREIAWRRVSLRGGPRVEAVSLSRTLSGPDGFSDEEGVFSFGVGAAAGLGVPVARGFEVLLHGRLSLVYVRVDEEALNLTYGALFAGLRYRL